MKRYIRQVPWLLAVTLLAPPLTAAQQGVAGLNEALASALKTGDLDAIMRLHDPAAVFYPPGEFERKGQEDIRFRWDRLLKINTIEVVPAKGRLPLRLEESDRLLDELPGFGVERQREGAFGIEKQHGGIVACSDTAAPTAARPTASSALRPKAAPKSKFSQAQAPGT